MHALAVVASLFSACVVLSVSVQSVIESIFRRL
jgi:hypothetical protein